MKIQVRASTFIYQFTTCNHLVSGLPFGHTWPGQDEVPTGNVEQDP